MVVMIALQTQKQILMMIMTDDDDDDDDDVDDNDDNDDDGDDLCRCVGVANQLVAPDWWLEVRGRGDAAIVGICL